MIITAPKHCSLQGDIAAKDMEKSMPKTIPMAVIIIATLAIDGGEELSAPPSNAINTTQNIEQSMLTQPTVKDMILKQLLRQAVEHCTYPCPSYGSPLKGNRFATQFHKTVAGCQVSGIVAA